MWKLPSLIMREHPRAQGGTYCTQLFYPKLPGKAILGWTPQPWQARPRSMQSGASPLATSCGSRHAPGESSCHADYRAARHFRSDWAIRTTFGLMDVGINRPFWPCSVLICYGTPEAAKHPHIAFAHLDYNGAV